MKKLIKYISIYVVLIVIINLSFWGLVGMKFSPVEDVYDNGFVIKIKPLNYAMVFSHGWYKKDCSANLTSCDHYHTIRLNNDSIATKDLLDDLYSEGYTKVWGSWCNTGNYPYMFKYDNGTEIEWYDWVSISGKKGTTIPIFTGVNFIRI